MKVLTKHWFHVWTERNYWERIGSGDGLLTGGSTNAWLMLGQRLPTLAQRSHIIVLMSGGQGGTLRGAARRVNTPGDCVSTGARHAA